MAQIQSAHWEKQMNITGYQPAIIIHLVIHTLTTGMKSMKVCLHAYSQLKVPPMTAQAFSICHSDLNW